MVVTPETWRIVRNTLRTQGVKKVDQSSDGRSVTITANNDELFEFPEDTIERLGASATFIRSYTPTSTSSKRA